MLLGPCGRESRGILDGERSPVLGSGQLDARNVRQYDRRAARGRSGIDGAIESLLSSEEQVSERWIVERKRGRND